MKNAKNRKKLWDDESRPGTTKNDQCGMPVYGDKTKLKQSNIDSGIGTEAPSTTGKSSMSVGDTREVYESGMEMQSLEGSRFHQDNVGRITVHVAQDDDVSEAPRTLPRSSSNSSVERPQDASNKDASLVGAESVASEAISTKSKLAPAIDPSLTLKPKSKQPKLVPLPFTVPDDRQEHVDEPSDALSVATFAASEHLPEQPKRSSKRLSGSELLRKLSGPLQKDVVASSMSQEALVIPHVEDDRSSIAATIDVVSDHNESEPALSGSNVSSPKKANFSGDDVKAPYPTSSLPRTVPDAEDEQKDKMLGAPSEESASLIRQANLLAGNLPEGGASKVVNAFRTNEWAKYLDRADAPSIEDLKLQKTRAAEGEKPIPVDVYALSQTATVADPAHGITKSVNDKSQRPSTRSRPSSAGKPTNPYRAQASSRPSRANPGGCAVANNMDRTTSQTSLASSTSSSAAPPVPKSRSSTLSLASPRAVRTASSSHLGPPLVESPLEEGVESSFPHSHFTPSASHLMSQRESIMRSKPSSTSLLRSGSGTLLNRHSSTSNTPNGSSMALNTLIEDDNISLSQRKSILQQQQASPRITSSTSMPLNVSRTSLNPNNPYNQTAHLSTASNLQLNTNLPHAARPHLLASSSSDAAISTWRASLAQLPTSEVQQQQELELRRRELLAEKNAVRHSRALEERSKEQRESVLGREMRRGSMMDAHQKAMRKMQASVNENLRPAGT